MNITLDLHGVRHHEVPRKVDQFLGEHLLKGSREVKIITGSSDKMKEIVNETLEDYQLTSSPTFGSNTSLTISLY